MVPKQIKHKYVRKLYRHATGSMEEKRIEANNHANFIWRILNGNQIPGQAKLSDKTSTTPASPDPFEVTYQIHRKERGHTLFDSQQIFQKGIWSRENCFEDNLQNAKLVTNTITNTIKEIKIPLRKKGFLLEFIIKKVS